MFEFSSFVANVNIGKKSVQSIQIVLLCLFTSTVILAQAAGSLDTSFGNNGIVTKDFGDKSADRIYATAIQPDGKILVSGEIADGYSTDSFVARYHPTGQLDTTFGTNGFVPRFDYVNSIIILADGKIIVGNSSTIRRLTASGQTDTTFGNSGFANVSFGGYIEHKSVSVQSDGKIIVVGSRFLNGDNHPAIKRFTANGQLDTTFGTNGEVVSTSIGTAITLAVQPDNRIVVSSYGIITCPPQNQCQNEVRLIARYTPTGQLDTSFGSGGTITANGFVPSIAIQSDGKILTGGNGISRYSTAGQLDASFGSGGTSFAASPGSIEIQKSDGKIIAGGFQSIRRLTTVGQLDTTFGSGGTFNTSGLIYSVAIQSNGSIVGGGQTTTSNSAPDTFLTRISAAGQLDASFGNSGIVSFNNRNGSETAQSIAIQSDGKIVVAGQRFVNGFTRGSITRFNAAGQLDTSFGTGGNFSTNNFDYFYSVAIQSDGKIVTSGYNGITRLTTTGQPDSTFGTGGTISTSFTDALTIQPDGKIIVVNYVSSSNSYVLARYTTAGQPDTSFGTGGTVPLGGFAYEISLQPDGKIIVGNYVSSSNSYVLARYTTAGQLDTSFGAGGTVAINSLNAIAVQPDGKIVANYNVGSNEVYELKRFTPNGQLDTSFGTGGTAPAIGFSSSLAIQRDGKIVGIFYQSSIRKYVIARYTATGQLDTTFGTGGTVLSPINNRFSNEARTIFIQNDNKIVVGGANKNPSSEDVDLAVLRYNAGPVFDPCTSFPISYGQTFNGNLNGSSCVTNGRYNDVYRFSGDIGDRIAITMDAAFFPAIELINSQGAVIQTVGGGDSFRSIRLPNNQPFSNPLTATGIYTIRVSSNFQGTGDYSLSLYKSQPASLPCTYSLSSPRTNVPSGGGTFFIDVLTQDGCPPAAAPISSGQIYSITSYGGGRLTFSVRPNSGNTNLTDTINVGGLTHTIFQSGNVAPSNDLFANSIEISGVTNPPNMPAIIDNTNATAEVNEKPHAGSSAAKSLWYKWKAPADFSGLYSFSTSGSSFDTVMDIYVCLANGPCQLTDIDLVGSNDNTTSFDKTSKVNFRAIAGTTYYIVVDGKRDESGRVATGTVQLSWMRYERLYRVYLQNFNGNPSSITPNSVTASNNNGITKIDAKRISQGVYEFSLPDDKTVYKVNIDGPTGIVWSPNNFTLGSSFALLNKPSDGESGEGNNSVSRSQNATQKSVTGYIKNITGQEISLLSVKIGSSRGANPSDPVDCGKTDSPIGMVPYITYQCQTQPNTLHDIIPNMVGKIFIDPIKSFDSPILNNDSGSVSKALVALDSSTFVISGRVLGGGAGTKVELTYLPGGNTQTVTLPTMTVNASGFYEFKNLPPGVYTIRASRTGFVFVQPADVALQTSGATVDIAVQQACTYESAQPISRIGLGGGTNSFVVKTNNSTCGWSAVSLVPWIQINSGSTIGDGPVHFTTQINSGPFRSGIIRVEGKDITIEQIGFKSRKRIR